MEKIDLGSVIQEALRRFNRNRIGNKPLVFVTIARDFPEVPWHDRSVKEFVRLFLYESFLTSDPDAAIEVVLRRKADLKDLNTFVGVHPSYWVEVRVSGRGLKIMEGLVEELFAGVGYRCQEWVGVEDFGARLGIFGAVDTPDRRMVFCLEFSRNSTKCDLLLPVSEPIPLPILAPSNGKYAAL